jgi:hypothetical protein
LFIFRKRQEQHKLCSQALKNEASAFEKPTIKSCMFKPTPSLMINTNSFRDGESLEVQSCIDVCVITPLTVVRDTG